MLNRYRQITLISVSLAIFMMVLTIGYWYQEYQQANTIRSQVFNESSDQIISNLNLRISRFELVLRGVKGFYESSDYVSKDEYSSYIQSLDISKNVRGFQAVVISTYVPQTKMREYLADMQRRGYTQFKIKPGGERAIYAPLSLVEPYAGSNLNALGYDLLTNPKIKLAVEEARDRDVLVVTHKLNLVQDQGMNKPAVVMYLPIYDISKPLNTVEARRAAIRGWVSGPFRIRDFIDAMRDEIDQDLALEIRENNELLFDSASHHTDLYTKRKIDIGRKEWEITIRSLPEFDARFPNNKLSALVIGGFVLSLMFGWLTWLLGSGRERAVLLANQMTHNLRQTKSDLECTLNAIPDVLFELDVAGRFHGYHTKSESLLVRPAAQLIGKNLTEVLPAKAAEICMAALREASVKGMASGHEIEIVLANQSRWFELSVAKRDDASVNPHFIMISREITDKKSAMQQLSIAAIAFESQEGIFVTDANNQILRVNNSFTMITGYSADEVMGQSPKMLNSDQHDKHFYASMWGSIQRHGSWMGEVWKRRKNGNLFPCQLSITAVKDAKGEVTNYVTTMIDITLSKAASDEIKTLAFYDALTRLPNRRLLIERLNQALGACKRSGRLGGLLFLDIDNFKNINDTLGHDVGDIFLQEVAKRLTACMRTVDTVARLGGDEYVVLLEDLESEPLLAASNVESCAVKILTALSQGYHLGEHQFHSTVSIGAVLFDKKNISTEELLKQADIAMYAAKKSGRNTLRFFDPKMQLAITSKTDLERELRAAVENNQFVLFYQMQVDNEKRIMGAEVLVRWLHPKRGIVNPAEFIPLAEETGLIIAIGHWVLDTTCAQLKAWEQDPQKNQLRLSVNVSAKQYHQANFVESVKSTIARHQINPSLINLELTESILLEDTEGTITSMNQLKEIGVKFELDDFGTGYSSLQYLKKLPLYQLKIDQSFVRDITENINDRTLVTTIISLAHNFDLKVIAEGVETAEQLEFLRQNNCDHYQGHYFSQPLPITAFEALLETGKKNIAD